MAKFVLGDRPRIWWPVEFTEAADGGKVQTVKFRAQFERLTASELQQTQADDADLDELLREKVCDWDGPTDSDTGEAVPFSAEALDQALEYLEVRGALVRALMEVSGGGGERGNSSKSRKRS